MYSYLITDYFEKELKRIIRKDPRIKENVKESLRKFKKENSIYLGKSVYKIRLRRNNKGKSGGYRLFIMLMEIEKALVPIHIFSKTEKENISQEEISEYLEIARRAL